MYFQFIQEIQIYFYARIITTEWKPKNNKLSETYLKSKNKIVETSKIGTPNTQIHGR